MHAPNFIQMVLLCLVGHLTDAESTDIVFAAVAHQDVVEILKADGAKVFELVEVKFFRKLNLIL